MEETPSRPLSVPRLFPSPESAQVRGSAARQAISPRPLAASLANSPYGLGAKRTLGVVPLPIMAASPPPVVVRVISPGPGLMTLLVTFLVGAATALVVQLVIQLYVVPKVEARKRRKDRWERDVRDLGELLTTLVSRRADEAYLAQLSFRFLHQELEGVSGVDEDKLARARREEGPKAYQATEAFHDLVNTRVDWLVDGIRSPDNPRAKIIDEFDLAARNYRVRAMISHWPEHDPRTGDAFEAEWKQEREARGALLKKVKELRRLPHPPRASRNARLKKRFKIRKTR